MTSSDPDVIRRQIEDTRRELSYDVDALNEKVNPTRVVDRRTLAEPVGPVDEQVDLLGGGHVERVDDVRRDPGDVVVDGLRRDLHRDGCHLGGDLGDHDRALALARRALAGSERVLGSDHPLTASSRRLVAACERALRASSPLGRLRTLLRR